MALPVASPEVDDLDLIGPPPPARGQVIPLFAPEARARPPEAALTLRPDLLTAELRALGVRRLFLGEGASGRRLYAELDLAGAAAPVPLAGDLVVVDHLLVIERLRPARGLLRARHRLSFAEAGEEVLGGVQWSRAAGACTVASRTEEALREAVEGALAGRGVPLSALGDLRERLRRLPEGFERAELLIRREGRLTCPGAFAPSGVEAVVPREVAGLGPARSAAGIEPLNR